MDNHALDGLALIELVQRMGGDRAALQQEYDALGHSMTVPDTLGAAAYLAGLVVSIAATTRFPLAALIAAERAAATAPPPE
jgi:hypothetical protein